MTRSHGELHALLSIASILSDHNELLFHELLVLHPNNLSQKEQIVGLEVTSIRLTRLYVSQRSILEFSHLVASSGRLPRVASMLFLSFLVSLPIESERARARKKSLFASS